MHVKALGGDVIRDGNIFYCLSVGKLGTATFGAKSLVRAKRSDAILRRLPPHLTPLSSPSTSPLAINVTITSYN